MVIHLPCIDLKPANVRINRQLLDEARAAYRGALDALNALESANQRVCIHQCPVRVHFDDPHNLLCEECGKPIVKSGPLGLGKSIDAMTTASTVDTEWPAHDRHPTEP